MDLMELLATRRTYRRFAQKPVPADVIADMVEAVRLSSCGVDGKTVKADSDAIAAAALADLCTPSNPRPATAQDVKGLLKELV